MVEFEDEQSLLIFQVGSFTFCVPAEEVTAIIQPPELTSLPLAPEYIMGTFMFRGEVATAISLRNKFKLTESDSKLLQLIVTRVGGNIAAFCVDAVDDIISASSVKWDDAKGMFESEAITRYAIYKSKILFMTQFINLFEVQAAERFTKMARDLVHSNGEALAQSAEQDSQIVSAAEEASLVGYATPSAIESHTDIEDQGIVENEAAQEAEWGLYSSIENTESDQAEQSASASVIESNEQEEAEWGLYSTVEENAPDQTPGAELTEEDEWGSYSGVAENTAEQNELSEGPAVEDEWESYDQPEESAVTPNEMLDDQAELHVDEADSVVSMDHSILEEVVPTAQAEYDLMSEEAYNQDDAQSELVPAEEGLIHAAISVESNESTLITEVQSHEPIEILQSQVLQHDELEETVAIDETEIDWEHPTIPVSETVDEEVNTPVVADENIAVDQEDSQDKSLNALESLQSELESEGFGEQEQDIGYSSAISERVSEFTDDDEWGEWEGEADSYLSEQANDKESLPVEAEQTRTPVVASVFANPTDSDLMRTQIAPSSEFAAEDDFIDEYEMNDEDVHIPTHPTKLLEAEEHDGIDSSDYRIPDLAEKIKPTLGVKRLEIQNKPSRKVVIGALVLLLVIGLGAYLAFGPGLTFLAGGDEESEQAFPAASSIDESVVEEEAQAETETQIAQSPQVQGDLPKGPTKRLLEVKGEEFTLVVERPISSNVSLRTDIKEKRIEMQASDSKTVTTLDLKSKPKAIITAAIPKQLKSGAKVIHIVKKGDTLWQIAGAYLGNPYRYPELAKVNHIKDPDWIYPNDIVRIERHPS